MGNADGGDFIYFASQQGLDVSMDPVVGGAMVWQNAGEGHVAIVEQIVSSTEIICSESGWYWTSPPVWDYKTHYYSNGRWHTNTTYHFRGCICPPGVPGNVDEWFTLLAGGFLVKEDE